MEIQEQYITLTDDSRNREIALKIYLPENPNPPVVIFSHGLGGSHNGYKYLAEFWAANGFAVIHPNHVGTDSSLLDEPRPFKALKDAANDPAQLHHRPQDIKFVLDWLETQDKFDSSKVGLAGHSFGAFTTLATIGQKHTSSGELLDYKDERILAAAALSPSAPRTDAAGAFADIDIPVLHITGTKDDSPVGLANPIDRRIPYDVITAGNQYLIIFDDADHMIFASQRRRNKFSPEDIKIMQSTCQSTLEFWKKYLLNGESAIDSDEFYANLPAQNLNERK